MNIIVDLMGGDKGPEELLKGTFEAIDEYNIRAILVGNQEIIEEEIKDKNYNIDKVEIINAIDTISNEDDPVRSIRRKKDSSMVIASKLLKEGRGQGLISTGNTGALLASGIFIVGRIEGAERAAISVLYPTTSGFSLLLDAGANADCKPEYLLQFAQMGSIYMEKVMGKSQPSVGLINVGVEEGKGNKLTKESYNLLKNSNLNFIGNLEARDLPLGAVDILVTDGFTGNIVLKLTEGMAISFMGILKDMLLKSVKTKLAAGLLSKDLKNLKEFMDYREYGGAPLLGINKPIVKAHGSSDSLAFKNGIKQLIDFIQRDIIKDIEKTFKGG